MRSILIVFVLCLSSCVTLKECNFMNKSVSEDKSIQINKEKKGSGEERKLYSKYYVSNDGNDDNTGSSPDQAWKSIAKVNAAILTAGTTIYFKRGDEWRESLMVDESGTSDSLITFTAYGSGAKPIINGADIVSGWSTDSKNIWYSNCPVITDYGMNYDYVVLVNGVICKQVGKKAEVNSAHKYFIDKTKSPDRAYIFTITDSDTVEISARMFGVGVRDDTFIKIEDLAFKNNAHSGVYFYAGISQVAGNSIIDHCDFYYNRQCAVEFDHGYSNNKVQYCNAYYNGNGFYSWGDASAGYGSDSNIFSHCYAGFSICYNAAGTVFTDGHGFGIYDSSDNIVEYCESEGNSYGIHIDCANHVRNVTYRYNYVHDTQFNTPGIGIGSNAAAGSYHIMYYNLIVNTGIGDPYGGEGVGIAIGGNGDRHVYVYNNTIYQDNSHNGTGIACMGGTSPGRNVHIRNNLIYSDNTNAVVLYLGTLPATGYEINNNLYYAPLSSAGIFGYQKVLYNSLGTWVTAVSQDGSSKYCDPLFTTTGSNFTLQSGSPAINAGVDVGLTQDILKNPIVGLPDVGCYEKQ